MYTIIVINENAVVCNATFDSFEDFNFVTDMYKIKFCHWYYDLDMEDTGCYRVMKFKKI